MRVRNLVWALLFVVPGTLLANEFAQADVGHDHSALVQFDADSQADALNLDEGAGEEFWGGFGGAWGFGGGWGGWGLGWGGGCCGGWGSWGGFGWPYYSYGFGWPYYSYYPWIYGGWGGLGGWGAGWGGGCGGWGW